MPKRALTTVLGIILIAIAAAWFLTPLSEMVSQTITGEAGAPQAASRSAEAPTANANFEMINMALNGLNALFGAVGILLMLRSARTAR